MLNILSISTVFLDTGMSAFYQQELVQVVCIDINKDEQRISNSSLG